ncbi:hypothetical protein TTRE_0000615901 [Trichuris trichiura]|uniref:Uncharacterized protein n=1 Tax=Trichuris trichiura TaxID=36087 RepID=A0A077ZE99_TRITR|nr:hypothetical protein TTRE_0000615901 [Trichuris trichiura]
MTTAVFANQPTASNGESQSFESQQEVYGNELTTGRQNEAMNDEGNVVVVTPNDTTDNAPTIEQTDTEERETYELPPTAKLYKKSDNGLMNWPAEAERGNNSWQEARRHSDIHAAMDNDESISAPAASIGRTTADESELDVFNEEHLTSEDRSADENEFLDESTLANVDMPEEEELNEGTEENGSQEQSSVIEDVFDQEEESDRQPKFNSEPTEEANAYMDVKLEYQTSNGTASQEAAQVHYEIDEQSFAPIADAGAATEMSDAEKPKDEAPYMDIQTHYEQETMSDVLDDGQPVRESEEAEEPRKSSIITSAHEEPLEQPPVSENDFTPDEQQIAQEESSLHEQSVQEEQKTAAEEEEEDTTEERSATMADIQREQVDEDEDEDKYHNYDAMSLKKTSIEKQLNEEESGSVFEEEEGGEEELEDAEESVRSQDMKEQPEEVRRESVQEVAETEKPIEEEQAPSVEEVPMRKPSETTSASVEMAKKISDATFANESNVPAEESSALGSRKGSDVSSATTLSKQESARRLSELSNVSEAGSTGLEEEPYRGSILKKKSSEPIVTPLAPGKIGVKKFSLPTQQLPGLRSGSSSRKSSDVTPVESPSRRESLRSLSKLGSTPEMGGMEEVSERDVEMSAEYSLPAGKKSFGRKASEPGQTVAKKLSQTDHAKSIDIPAGTSSRKGSNATPAESTPRRESLRRHSKLSFASDLEEKEQEALAEQSIETPADYTQPTEEVLDRKTSETIASPPLTPSQMGSKPVEAPMEESSALSSRKSSSAAAEETTSRRESLKSLSTDSAAAPEALAGLKEEVQIEPDEIATAAQYEPEQVTSPTIEQEQPRMMEQPPVGKFYKEIPVEEEKLVTPSEPSPAKKSIDATPASAELETPTAQLVENKMENAEELRLEDAEIPKTEVTDKQLKPSEESYKEEEEGRDVEATAFVPITPKKTPTEAPVKTREVQASTEYRQYYPLYESRTPATMSVSSMASSYSSDYSRPYNHYVSVFDSHVTTGPFSQNNYFALRRSVSRERMSSSLSRVGSFSRFDSYHDFLPYTASRSTAQIPVRSTSFSRFMDYYDRVKDRLKRTYSRESLYRPKETHATYLYSNIYQPSTTYSSVYQPSVPSLYGYNYNYSYGTPRRNVYRTYSQENVYTPSYRSYSYPTRTYGAFNKIYDYYTSVRNRYTQSSFLSPFRRIRSFYRPWKFDNSLF